MLTRIIVLLCCLLFAAIPALAQEDFIGKLWQELQELQWKHDQSMIFPIQWKQMKGLWPSFGKVNSHGNWEEALLRKSFAVPDNNGFVTAWIMEILLDAHSLGTINLTKDAKSIAVINSAFDVLLQFKDNNFPPQIPICDFWTQIKNNWSVWEQHPTNFVEPLSDFENAEELVHHILQELGLESLWERIQGPFFSFMLSTIVDSFNIPGDFDDTAVSLAMNLHLQNAFPSLYNAWLQKYPDFGGLSDYWTRYAYQPFSSDVNVNSIDPRTYYWIRGFLDLHVGEDIRLITTWASDIARNNVTHDQGVSMPFNANNVDASVGANGVFGLVSAALMLPTDKVNALFTDKMQGMLLNTSSLISWVIESGIAIERPDIVLLYYPPLYDFYWFASRTLFALRNLSSSSSSIPPSLHSVLEQVKGDLQQALEGIGTKQLLELKGEDSALGWVYWDGFLGDGDISSNGKPVIEAEDRLFSTAITVNALLDIWTVPTDKCGRAWISYTPPVVVSNVVRAVDFLLKNIFGEKYAKENCFFSGSMKGDISLPFNFPGNFIYYANGTAITPLNRSQITEDVYDLVSGYIPPQEYQVLLQQKWFGASVPTSFPGFNGDGISFPFWSSPALTYAATLSALSKYEVAVACN